VQGLTYTATRQLTSSPTPNLDAEVLLAHALGWTRDELYRQPRAEVGTQQRELYLSYVRRRARHEPVAYITGVKQFYGLTFQVTPDVLIPRPETELLVELALDAARRRDPGCQSKPDDSVAGGGEPLLADVGTGCGAVAIALAVNLPQVRIIATDVSSRALGVARRNATSHGVAKRVALVRGDLLEPLSQRTDIVVANLPYIADHEFPHLPPDVRDYEPRAALRGGETGTEVIEGLLTQTPRRLAEGGTVLVEIGHAQARRVCAAAQHVFPDATIEVVKDLGEYDRVVAVYTGRRP
jgi:release factor glutamine methyltransferase